MGRLLLNAACLSLLVRGGIAAEDSTCKAGEACKTGFNSPYYWPHAHGHPGYYGNPPWPGPTDLPSSFKWRWNGPTGVLYSESFNGAVIDDKKNIYVNGDKHVYKLSPDGQVLWTYETVRAAAANGPALMDGVYYGDTTEGYVFAVDMETGKQKWLVRASSHNGGEYGHISAHNGVVVTEGDQGLIPPGAAMAGNMACQKVRGLNASNGKELWSFKPDGVLWDWFPQFPDDESVIFMDHWGVTYRLKLKTGELIWKNGGIPHTWTDGCQFLSNNGLVYAVSIDSFANCPPTTGGVPECPGYVTAFKVSDGTEVFKVKVPKPPNTAPVVGQLTEGGKPALVMPIGQQTGGCQPEAVLLWYWLPFLGALPEFLQRNVIFPVFHQLSILLGDDYNWILWGKATVTHDILVFDAETGSFMWKWEGPTSTFKMAPGDREGFIPRTVAGIRSISCPTPWGAPRIGSDGTIYLGNQNGDFYAIRDKNGDGHIDNEKEVSTYKTKGVFTHIGSAHAPGMVVAVNFDSVFVFKD